MRRRRRAEPRLGDKSLGEPCPDRYSDEQDGLGPGPDRRQADPGSWRGPVRVGQGRNGPGPHIPIGRQLGMANSGHLDILESHEKFAPMSGIHLATKPETPRMHDEPRTNPNDAPGDRMKSAASQFRKGRNITDGYTRGWGLQFGDLRQKVREDKLYQEAARFASGRSVISEDNRMNIFLIIRNYLKLVPFGHLVEFGSYKGGNALFMAYCAARLYPGVQVYAFDTFSGMPETDAGIDAHNAGDFADVDLAELAEFSRKNGFGNITFVKGVFEQTAPGMLPQIENIALAHIDCDIYSAVAYSYDAARRYMVEGGYLVFDDAVYSSCLGATEAVEELAIRRDGLNCEQIFPQFVFRAPASWRNGADKGIA